VIDLLSRLHERHPDRAVLATRLDDAAMTGLAAQLPEAIVDEVAHAATLGPLPPGLGRVLILSAGTSDAPVAREAALSARVHGSAAEEIHDVGVAGLHRLLAVRDRLDAADCLVVVAGMEGALPSVVGGLTGVPLIAVPTSVGYGASLQGMTAMLAMLTSCAAGIGVVNVDNGFGAGVLAARIARNVGAARASSA
jgi:NCAIR mutase (PurE)-related protein